MRGVATGDGAFPTPPPSALAATAACFDKVQLVGERVLQISYAKDRVNTGKVLAALQAAGLGIGDVSTKEADLEHVFLNLTRAVG